MNKNLIDNIDEICELYLHGKTTQAIAKQFKCTPPTIVNFLKKKNIERIKNPTRRISEKIKQQICKEYSETKVTISFLVQKIWI